MIETLHLTHWLASGFLLLIWCVEHFAQRWTGYRFVYRLYALLPLLVLFTLLIQANAPALQIPEVMASLSVANTVPAAVARHINALQWVWFAGAVILLAGLTRQWFGLRRLSGQRIHLGSAEALISKHVASPCLKGVFRPVILLPDNYRDKFSAGELALIIEHEQVHARRMDNLWNIVALGLRTLFWFNPLMWLGYHRFRLAQELSCDETVLADQPAHVPLAYARTLLAASVFPKTQQPLCSHYGDKKMMLKRMHCIKSAGLVSRGVQWLLLCAVLTVSGSLGAIAATGTTADQDPVRTIKVPPKYPRSAMEAHEEADVIVKFNIGASDGRPFEIRVVENTAKADFQVGFNQAAIDAVRQWQYEPQGRVLYGVKAKLGFKLQK